MLKLSQLYEESLASLDHRLVARLRALFQACAVYAAVGLLLVGAHIWGVSTLPRSAAWLLASGFAAANLLVAGLACHPLTAGWPRSRLVAIQAVAAIVAASIYTILHAGGAEVPAFLYLVALLTAMPRVAASNLRWVGGAACGAFAFALAVSAAGRASLPAVGSGLTAIGFLTAGVALLCVYATRVNQRHLQAHFALARLQSTIRVLSARSDRETWQRSFRREHIAAVLEKEKARADRTGRSFCICMLDQAEPLLPGETPAEPVGRSIGSLAERAMRILRATDTVSRTRYRRSLGRSGAEEFIAVFPETRLAHARSCAERLTRLGVTGLAASKPAAAALVAGIAEYEPGEGIATLLRRADLALRSAQGSGAGAIKGALSAHHVGRPPPKPRLRVVR